MVSLPIGIIGIAFRGQGNKVIPVLCLYRLEELWGMSHSRIRVLRGRYYSPTCTCIG